MRGWWVSARSISSRVNGAAAVAAVAGLRARHLKRNFPIDLDQPYYRKLADSIGAGTPAVLRVIPYSYTLDEPRDRGLWAIAAAALGGGVLPAAYAERRERWLSQLTAA